MLQSGDLKTSDSLPPQIAILDDEACIRIALERLLRSAGFRVKAYADAINFLSNVSAEPPDALVLDLRMPGIDGFDVLMALKAIDVQVPVLVLTAEYAPVARERAMAAGAVIYLIKPVNDSDLIEGVNLALAHSKKMPN
jgi:FixJ family two-component response regulator